MRRKRDGELVALADEIDAAERAHVRGQERDAERRRKQALERQGEEMLAAVSAAMAAAARRRAPHIIYGTCADTSVTTIRQQRDAGRRRKEPLGGGLSLPRDSSSV